MRVVSLLPSATEVLCAIGGRGLLVGRSHECDFPHGIGHLPALTAARTRYQSAAQVDADVRRALQEREVPGTAPPAGGAAPSLYTLDAQRLAGLRPDVILTQDLCSVCSIDLSAVHAVAAQLSPPPRIISLNPATFEGVLDDLLTVGRAVGLEREAQETLVRLRERLYAAADHVNRYTDGPTVAFLDWPDPLFIAGHWTPQLIERAGGRHPLNRTVPAPNTGAAAGPVGETLRAAGPSRQVTAEALIAARPDALIVCPCGLTLDQTRAEVQRLAATSWWRELPAVRAARVALVDGNQMFNRPGPRLVDAFEWLVAWLNERPELIPAGFPWEVWNR